MNAFGSFTIHLTYSKVQLALGATIYKAGTPYSNHVLILHPLTHTLHQMVMVLLLVEYNRITHFLTPISNLY